MVTTENYEEYMMLDADGELDSTGKAALLAFIAANPALKEEYDAWQAIRLQPDLAQTYPDKQALLKQEHKGMAMTFRPYMLAAAAALLAAIVLIPSLWKKDGTVPQFVHEFRQNPAVPQPATPADTVLGATPLRKLPLPDARRTHDEERLAKRLVHDIQAVPTVEAVVHADPVIALQPVAGEALAAGAVMAPQPLHAELPPVEAPMPKSPNPEVPRITLAPENRAALDALKGAVATRIAQVSAAARSIQETTLVIKLGNGSVNLNF